MKHLREKIHYPCFQFCKVVQKHYLGEVKNIKSFNCLLS